MWICMLGMGVELLSASGEAETKKKSKEIPVVVAPVKKMIFEDIVEITGNVEAKNLSVVSARISGIIDDIYVDEGDKVVAGQTRLFQIDKANLTRALEIAQQGVEVAMWALKAREATIHRVEADLKKAEIDYRRFKRLYDDNKAVTITALEARESRYRQLVAALSEAQAAANLAQRQKEQAENNRLIAVKDLADSLTRAPISGHVSERFHEPGEMAQRGAAVLRIEDLSKLEIAGFMPEAYYHRVIPGETLTQIVIAGQKIEKLPIHYKSPTIDAKLRNFIIKAILTNPPAGGVPGAMAKINVVLEQHEGVGVPQVAVLNRAGRSIVFIQEEEHASAIPVKTGLRTNGFIEIYSDRIEPGTQIITMGQDMIDDGSPIIIVEEEGRR